MREIHLFSPAKINLFFKILGKRPDGYHEVVSHIQALNFGDYLRYSLSTSNALHCLEADIPKDETNLIFKALAAFNKRLGLDLRLTVHLDKYIPMQAGLGGGSSNAATTLYALRELTGLAISDEVLASIAGEFSSDAPFFLSHGSAICFGRGEQFMPAKQPLEEKVTLIWPNFGVSTPACFKQVIAPKIGPSAENQEKIFFNGQLLENDLEKPAFSLEPRLEDMKTQIQLLGFSKVLMTGSGSCFYACGSSHSPIPQNWNHIVAEPLLRRGASWYEKRVIC